MTRTIAAVALTTVALSSIACHKNSSPPTAPSSAPGAAVTSLEVQGPSRMAPGDTAQFTAIATFGDRTMRNYTKDVKWVGFPREVLTVSETGEAVALARGDAHVLAFLPSGCGSRCPAETAVVVLPPNTYRLTGKVLESGLPVQGATATVIGGSDSRLSSTTDYDGQYRLYGVAGSVQITVAKSGYEDMAKAVAVTADDVLDFPEARQIGTIPLVSGTYALTLQADNDCSTAPSAYNVPPLPPEARQRRTVLSTGRAGGPVAIRLAAATAVRRALEPVFRPDSSQDGRVRVRRRLSLLWARQRHHRTPVGDASDLVRGFRPCRAIRKCADRSTRRSDTAVRDP